MPSALRRLSTAAEMCCSWQPPCVGWCLFVYGQRNLSNACCTKTAASERAWESKVQDDKICNRECVWVTLLLFFFCLKMQRVTSTKVAYSLGKLRKTISKIPTFIQCQFRKMQHGTKRNSRYSIFLILHTFHEPIIWNITTRLCSCSRNKQTELGPRGDNSYVHGARLATHLFLIENHIYPTKTTSNNGVCVCVCGVLHCRCQRNSSTWDEMSLLLCPPPPHHPPGVNQAVRQH